MLSAAAAGLDEVWNFLLSSSQLGYPPIACREPSHMKVKKTTLCSLFHSRRFVVEFLIVNTWTIWEETSTKC